MFVIHRTARRTFLLAVTVFIGQSSLASDTSSLMNMRDIIAASSLVTKFNEMPVAARVAVGVVGVPAVCCAGYTLCQFGAYVRDRCDPVAAYERAKGENPSRASRAIDMMHCAEHFAGMLDGVLADKNLNRIPTYPQLMKLRDEKWTLLNSPQMGSVTVLLLQQCKDCFYGERSFGATQDEKRSRISVADEAFNAYVDASGPGAYAAKHAYATGLLKQLYERNYSSVEGFTLLVNYGANPFIPAERGSLPNVFEVLAQRELTADIAKQSLANPLYRSEKIAGVKATWSMLIDMYRGWALECKHEWILDCMCEFSMRHFSWQDWLALYHKATAVRYSGGATVQSVGVDGCIQQRSMYGAFPYVKRIVGYIRRLSIEDYELLYAQCTALEKDQLDWLLKNSCDLEIYSS